jgi:hypothetical protein
MGQLPGELLMSRPSLMLFREPWLGEAFLENISQNAAIRWQRSYRRQGGFWVGTLDIPADRRVSIEQLERVWFNGGLMKRFKEATGSTVTWEGVVWEVELTRDGVKRSRSVADVWNASRVIGRNESGDPLDSGWYTNQASINRYLRRELILTVDRATSAQAIAEAQNVLVESAEAWPQRKQFGKDLEDGVRVTVVGDVFTANNRYVSVASPGTTDTVSDHITSILTTDCDLLKPTSITANSVENLHRLFDADSGMGQDFRADRNGRWNTALHCHCRDWWPGSPMLQRQTSPSICGGAKSVDLAIQAVTSIHGRQGRVFCVTKRRHQVRRCLVRSY